MPTRIQRITFLVSWLVLLVLFGCLAASPALTPLSSPAPLRIPAAVPEVALRGIVISGSTVSVKVAILGPVFSEPAVSLDGRPADEVQVDRGALEITHVFKNVPPGEHQVQVSGGNLSRTERVLVIAPIPTLPPTPTVASIPSPTITPIPVPLAQRLVLDVVASGLEVPWALAFAPDGRLFFTERPGRVRVVQSGTLLAEPVATLKVAHVVEAGLLGIALDPDFSSNRYLYLYYTYADSRNRLWNRVERFSVQNNQLKDPRVIIDGIPGAAIHDGGRIKFGPDSKLYITTGDSNQPDLSQDLSSLAGKVLRLNSDGSIPGDNPFPGSPVYSYGHRNPQGLAWHPVTGQLFATEHGPTGFDEVNILQPGKSYGWPTVRGIAGRRLFEDPIAEYSPSIAPSGAAFYDGDQYPQWRDSLFFGTLIGSHLHRIALKSPGYQQVLEEEKLFLRELGRLREVVQGPDGYIYITTNNRDGRGSPARDDDRILRIRFE